MGTGNLKMGTTAKAMTIMIVKISFGLLPVPAFEILQIFFWLPNLAIELNSLHMGEDTLRIT